MKRNKALIIFLVAFFTLGSAFAFKVTAKGPVITKKVIVKSFTKLDVRSQFDVYLTQGDKEELKIKTYESIMPYVDVDQRNGQLMVSLDKKLNNIKWLNRDHILEVHITVKELERVELSGACDLYMMTPLVTEDLKISASGASDLDLMKIEGKNIKIITSGASDIDDGDFDVKKLYINASGASDGNIKVVAEVLDMIASGASDFDIDVNVEELGISAHGSSDFDAKGKSRTFVINVSGSSDMDAFDLTSDTIIVDASGGSVCKINAIKFIDASSSGASSIYYIGKPDKTKIQVSGVSSIQSK